MYTTLTCPAAVVVFISFLFIRLVSVRWTFLIVAFHLTLSESPGRDDQAPKYRSHFLQKTGPVGTRMPTVALSNLLAPGCLERTLYRVCTTSRGFHIAFCPLVWLINAVLWVCSGHNLAEHRVLEENKDLFSVPSIHGILPAPSFYCDTEVRRAVAPSLLFFWHIN